MVLWLTDRDDRDDLSQWCERRLQPLIKQFIDMPIARATEPLHREIAYLRERISSSPASVHGRGGVSARCCVAWWCMQRWPSALLAKVELRHFNRGREEIR